MQILDANATVLFIGTEDQPLQVVQVQLRGSEPATTARVRVQGDGIDFQTLGPLLEAVKRHGWSVDKIAFGSGGGLFQKLNRDTLKFAFKCASIRVGDQERDVYKRPITDQGKKSKSGRFKLVRATARGENHDGPGYATVKETDPGDDLLQVVFENGELTAPTTLAEVRRRAAV